LASLLIATPCYGKLLGEGYFHSVLATIDLLRAKGHEVKVYTIGNESLITRARNNQVAYFLSSTHDHMMFIDADITWAPKAVLDLIESQHDVCGIPYPTKMRDWEKMMAFIKNKHEKGEDIKPKELMNSSLRFTINRIGKTDSPKDGWIEVDALGTGFLLIKRQVLEKMRDHYRETLNYKNDVKGYMKIAPEDQCVGLFETMIDPKTRRYLSEDYAFCRRWIDIGGKIHANVKHRIVHSGTADF
jgi:glycosyltransferase involved in cell wall biosynthesis